MSFFVTTIAYYPDDKEKRYDEPHKRTCTFGHFGNLKDAQEAVVHNVGGMDECLYNYLVISEVGYGIYAGILNDNDEKQCEWWYTWYHPDDQIGHWIPMNKPDWSRRYTCWALS